MSLIDKLRGARRVKMLVSVGGDHVAGKEYSVPAEVADRYIARGYASGAMSRAFSPEEMTKLRGNPQVVSLGG